MKRAWLCGWSVDCDAFARLCAQLRPEEEALVFPPTSAGIRALEQTSCGAFGGYSLGAHLLLDRASDSESPLSRCHDVLALAPFLSFAAEYGREGKIRKAQLALVRKRVEKDPEAAVREFHALAGLTGLRAETPPASRDTLLEGLARLAAPGVDAPPPLCAFWQFAVGLEDPLLEAEAIASRLPPGTCQTIPYAGHAPGPLLSKLQRPHAF